MILREQLLIKSIQYHRNGGGSHRIREPSAGERAIGHWYIRGSSELQAAYRSPAIDAFTTL